MSDDPDDAVPLLVCFDVVGIVFAIVATILNGLHWSDCGMKLNLDEPLGKVGSWGFICANIDIVCLAASVIMVFINRELLLLSLFMAVVGLLTGFSGVVLSGIELAEGCGTNGTTAANATTNEIEPLEIQWLGPAAVWGAVGSVAAFCCVCCCIAAAVANKN